MARQKPFKDLKDEEYGPVPKNLMLGAQRFLSDGGRGSIMGIYEDHGNGREKKGIKWDTQIDIDTLYKYYVVNKLDMR